MAKITGTINPDVLTGTVGADILLGLAGDDMLYGYDANDSIDGGDGDDFLYGGSGDDTLVGGAGEDFFFGQSGLDTASYSTATAGLTLNLVDTFQSSGDARGDFFFSVERFVLSGFDDAFLGSASADFAFGGAGNDNLQGLAGSDDLNGDLGDDVLIGGAGADTLNGGTGFDVASYIGSTDPLAIDQTSGISTGDAAGDVYIGIEELQLSNFSDTINMDGSIRRVEGAGGDDGMTGSIFSDTIFGGAGSDGITGGLGNDVLYAGDEADPNLAISANGLNGEGGNDLLYGGNVMDLLIGDSGNDTEYGGGGSDTLQGGVGNDVLSGGDGNDFLYGGLGLDAMDGGAGIDAVVYAVPVKVNFASPGASTGEALGDTFSGIEQVIFTGATGSYVGGTANLTVTSSNSVLTAMAGAGAEHFEIENKFQGSLNVSYAAAPSAVTLTADGSGGLLGSGWAAGDQLTFARGLGLGNFADTLDLGAGSSGAVLASVSMAGGNDRVILGMQDQLVITLDAGNDSVSGFLTNSRVFGGGGSDLFDLTGTSASLSMLADGGDGSDHISLTGYSSYDAEGGAGNDLITITGQSGMVGGGDGNDRLIIAVQAIASANTKIDGGAGNDVLAATGSQPFGLVAACSVVLSGGAGDDLVTGIADSSGQFVETFLFNAGWGHDMIRHFDLGVDRVLLSSAGVAAFNQLTISGSASHTLVSFGSDDFDLIGVNVAGFTAASVDFA